MPIKRVMQVCIFFMAFQISFISADTQRMRPERVSSVEAIDFLTNTITFKGQKYQLTTETKWYGLEPGEKPQNKRDLKNRRIGYTAAFPKEGLPAITQIWVQ